MPNKQSWVYEKWLRDKNFSLPSALNENKCWEYSMAALTVWILLVCTVLTGEFLHWVTNLLGRPVKYLVFQTIKSSFVTLRFAFMLERFWFNFMAVFEDVVRGDVQLY